MAATPATLNTLLRHPYVLGVISRLKPAGTAFQQFYNMGAASVSTEPANINRHVVYDIFDHTRTNAQGRSPMVGPSRIPAKPIGQAHATAMRMYESITFPYEKVYSIRQLGGQPGPLDARGQSWVMRQMGYMAERMANSIEFMISRMFRGGFSITIDGDNWTLGELGSGTVDVPYQIPATNKTDLDGIIDAEWDLAGTKIIDHMLEVNKRSQLLTGYEIKHVWINSTTYKYMLANTQLQAVRGTAMRVFDQFAPNNVSTADGGSRSIGFNVMFPAMPQFMFHVYDGTSVVSSQTDPAANTTSTDSYYVPDGVAIMTPEAELGGWHGMYHGAEPIRENDEDESTLKEGLASWTKRMNDPPGEELRVLHNLVPLLYNPKSVFYATVWS